jgi:hypothetical protein
MNFAGAKRFFEVCVFEVCGEERTFLRDSRFRFARLEVLLCEAEISALRKILI